MTLLLTEEQAAERLLLTPRTLRKLRQAGEIRYVALTAPYYHNGSARTLEALIAENHDRMGKTSLLTGDEQRALVAYLRSL